MQEDSPRYTETTKQLENLVARWAALFTRCAITYSTVITV